MEYNSDFIQTLVTLLSPGVLIILFYGVLWTLGTRDRKRILFLLHRLIHLIENGNDKNDNFILKKGGEEL